MKATHIVSTVVFALIATICVSASASIETFDFRGTTNSNDIGHSKVFTSDSGNFTLTASAWRGTDNDDAPFTNLDATFLSQYTQLGIGVEHAVDGDGDNDPSEPIGSSSNDDAELLRIDLSSIGVDVRLTQIVFSWVRDEFDEFDLSVDNADVDIRAEFSWTPFNSGDQGSIRRIAGGGNGGSNDIFTVNVPNTVDAGRVFDLYTDDAKDQYKVKRVKFDIVIPPPTETNTPVPEPGSLLVWSMLGVAVVTSSRRMNWMNVVAGSDS